LTRTGLRPRTESARASLENAVAALKLAGSRRRDSNSGVPLPQGAISFGG